MIPVTTDLHARFTCITDHVMYCDTKYAYTFRYGDDLAYENSDAYVAEILALVRQQNIHQCSATQGILLEELEFKHMYDACIYFISPHQLKPRDLKFMSSISKVVPVIPVIAKADSMTPEERQKFRDHINKSLNSPAVLGTACISGAFAL